MSEADHISGERENLRSWLVPIGLAVGFLIWGMVVFYAVGVKWPPSWDFGAVEDVPGKSVYSTNPFHEEAVLTPQHVKEPYQKGVKKEEETAE